MSAARKNGKGQPPARGPAKTKLDYPFAPVPRALIRDPRVSSDAVKLWCVLHDLFFQEIAPEIPTLRARMTATRTKQRDDGSAEVVQQPAGRASIFRWLHELCDGGWLRWNRNAGQGDRFELLTGPADDAALTALRQLRTLLRSNTATLDDVRAVLDGVEESQQRDSESHNRDSESQHRDSESHDGDSESHDRDSESQQRDSYHYRDMRDDHETAADTMPARHPAAAAAVADPVVALLADMGITTADEFAGLPLDQVQARIDRIQRNPSWRPSDIVTSLRKHPPRAGLPRGRAPASGPIDVERYTSGAYGDLFRAGGDTSDLDVAALDQHEAGRD